MGGWTVEEDAMLQEAMKYRGVPGKQSHARWLDIAELVPGRGPKSCRLRWDVQLANEINRSEFSEEEKDFVMKYQRAKGNKWAEIARVLSEKAQKAGLVKFRRTDNQVKNLWHARLKIGRVSKSYKAPPSRLAAKPVRTGRPPKKRQAGRGADDDSSINSMDEEQDEVDGTSSGEDSFPPEEDLPQRQGDYAQPSALDIAPIDPNIPARLMLPPHVGEKLQKIIASLREKEGFLGFANAPSGNNERMSQPGPSEGEFHDTTGEEPSAPKRRCIEQVDDSFVHRPQASRKAVQLPGLADREGPRGFQLPSRIPSSGVEIGASHALPTSAFHPGPLPTAASGGALPTLAAATVQVQPALDTGSQPQSAPLEVSDQRAASFHGPQPPIEPSRDMAEALPQRSEAAPVLPQGSATPAATPLGSGAAASLPQGSAPLAATPLGSETAASLPQGSAPPAATPLGSETAASLLQGSAPPAAIPAGSATAAVVGQDSHAPAALPAGSGPAAVVPSVSATAAATAATQGPASTAALSPAASLAAVFPLGPHPTAALAPGLAPPALLPQGVRALGIRPTVSCSLAWCSNPNCIKYRPPGAVPQGNQNPDASAQAPRPLAALPHASQSLSGLPHASQPLIGLTQGLEGPAATASALQVPSVGVLPGRPPLTTASLDVNGKPGTRSPRGAESWLLHGSTKIRTDRQDDDYIKSLERQGIPQEQIDGIASALKRLYNPALAAPQPPVPTVQPYQLAIKQAQAPRSQFTKTGKRPAAKSETSDRPPSYFHRTGRGKVRAQGREAKPLADERDRDDDMAVDGDDSPAPPFWDSASPKASRSPPTTPPQSHESPQMPGQPGSPGQPGQRIWNGPSWNIECLPEGCIRPKASKVASPTKLPWMQQFAEIWEKPRENPPAELGGLASRSLYREDGEDEDDEEYAYDEEDAEYEEDAVGRHSNAGRRKTNGVNRAPEQIERQRTASKQLSNRPRRRRSQRVRRS